MNSDTMRRILRIAKLMLMAMGLSGCLATPYFRPASVSLCQVVDPGGWTASGTGLRLERDGSTYFFRVTDEGSHNADYFGTSGRYWIMISAYTGGSRGGLRAPPMEYDPNDAYLEVGGKRLPAKPVIWQAIQERAPGSPRRGNFLPQKALSAPLNLNDKAFESPAWFYLEFEVEQPSSRDTYRFWPGSIKLDGIKTELPIFHSCYRPADRGWTPIH
jgi:hypothetical protein